MLAVSVPVAVPAVALFAVVAESSPPPHPAATRASAAVTATTATVLCTCDERGPPASRRVLADDPMSLPPMSRTAAFGVLPNLLPSPSTERARAPVPDRLRDVPEANAPFNGAGVLEGMTPACRSSSTVSRVG